MGYFPLDRELKNHWIYKDSQYLHVWIEMLFRARYSEEPKTSLHEGELITVEYGEFIFGRISWSKDLNVSEQRLRTLLSKLKKEEMIVLTKQYRKSSVYMVKNYRKYNQQSNQQERHTQQGFEGYSNQQTNATPTSNQPATNQQVTTKEESNKEIREEGKENIVGTKVPERKKFIQPSLEEVTTYCYERGNRVDPENWLDHYTSNGWKVGKNQMKDWKAAVRTWEKNAVGSTSTFKTKADETKRQLDLLNIDQKEGVRIGTTKIESTRRKKIIELDKNGFPIF